MDALVAAASRALARGDPLGALQHVALRDDPPALALRGIAMAQLGDLAKARDLLRRARRAFGTHEAVARARCTVAEAEVALAMRDLAGRTEPLQAAANLLAARGDAVNAAQGQLVLARRLLLLGRGPDAAAALQAVDARGLPPLHAALAHLAAAELALRQLQPGPARAALEQAAAAAQRADVGTLQAEIAGAAAGLAHPAARLLAADGTRWLTLDDVVALLASPALVVDACRRTLRRDGAVRALAGRPVLFELLRALAQAWPGAATRQGLIERVFRLRQPDETHRARLRVELGRLRALAAPWAEIVATRDGYRLHAGDDRPVALIAPPTEGDEGAIAALLADGTAWATSALALALGTSQRSVQRALAALQQQGRVQAVGRARARRWRAAPLTGFATILSLPAARPPA